MEDLYHFLVGQRKAGKIQRSIPDAMILDTAESEGWLMQSNHLLHNGMTTGQYLEFETAINVLEEENGGATMTIGYGNMKETCAAKQRAQNTWLDGLPLAKESPRRGVDPGRGGAGKERGHKKDNGMEVIPCPVNFLLVTPQQKKGMVG